MDIETSYNWAFISQTKLIINHPVWLSWLSRSSSLITLIGTLIRDLYLL